MEPAAYLLLPSEQDTAFTLFIKAYHLAQNLPRKFCPFGSLPTFTVAYRDIMRFFFEYRSVQSPRRSGTYHTSPYNTRNVAVDVVECKGWRERSFLFSLSVCARLSDFSVWNEACLNEGLETVTDTKNKVFLFQVRSDCVGDSFFSDYVCDEFS